MIQLIQAPINIMLEILALPSIGIPVAVLLVVLLFIKLINASNPFAYPLPSICSLEAVETRLLPLYLITRTAFLSNEGKSCMRLANRIAPKLVIL